jgi:hypothetical protein
VLHVTRLAILSIVTSRPTIGHTVTYAVVQTKNKLIMHFGQGSRVIPCAIKCFIFHRSLNEAWRSLMFECLIFPVICLIPRPKWLFWPGVHSRFDSALSVNEQRDRVTFPKSMTATGLCLTVRLKH